MDQLTVFAVNRDLNSSIDLKCELRGFSTFEILEHIIYESEDKKARNSKEKPLNITPHNRGNAIIRDQVVSAHLPKLSWNVIRLQRKESL